MKSILKLCFFFIFITLITSCEKDDTLSDSQRIENELKSVVQNYNITKCNIYTYINGESILEQNDFPLSISEGLVIVKYYGNSNNYSEYRYNLLYLMKYVVIKSDNGNSLNLYFSK